MVDKETRIVLGTELLREGNLNVPQKIYIYYNPEYKRLDLKKDKSFSNLYYVKEQSIDHKGRMFIPASIRKAFPEATYLPAVMCGEIYIFIIQHEKKSE